MYQPQPPSTVATSATTVTATTTTTTTTTVTPAYNPYSAAYAAQYNLAALPAQQALPFYSPYPTQQLKPVVSELVPPPPDPIAITPAVASHATQKLIVSELQHAGFDSAEASAVKRLELEVTAFIEHLFERAHEYANLANRAGPIATDLLLTCDELNMPSRSLRSLKSRISKKRRPSEPPVLIPASSRSPSPELLHSDDEETQRPIPLTLRNIPSNLPHLPPKHTYLRTPASPPKKAALPSLEKKLKTASLVQESLRNLMVATEDTTNQEDGELLGHIVNWEMGMYPRKRWKMTR